MSGLGGHPILTMGFNTTIAASLGGTADSTVLNSSFPATYARYMQVYNYTLRDMEIIISSGDQGTANTNMFFVPGVVTAAGTFAMQGQLLPIAIAQGAQIRARTLADTPITVSTTALPLRFNFWA